MIYPPTRPALTGTAADAHNLLKNAPMLARRLGELLENTLLADFLLTGRLEAVGGSVLFEDAPPTVEGDAETVAPGAEYPLAVWTTSLNDARTEKWGLATEVTDEAVARLQLSAVNRSLDVLRIKVARQSDTAAMAAVKAAVTGTFDSTTAGAWTDAESIVAAVLSAQAAQDDTEEGVVYDTVVLKPSHYAAVMSTLVKGGVFPREAEGNPLTAGAFPTFMGMTWTSSPRADTRPLLADRTKLGALAFENLQSPGYARTPAGVEVQTDRLTGRDAYLVNARRVMAAAVLDPGAAVFVTNTGLA